MSSVSEGGLNCRAETETHEDDRADDGGSDIVGSSHETAAESTADQGDEPDDLATAEIADARDGRSENGARRVPTCAA